jgi:heat shock protein HtpX
MSDKTVSYTIETEVPPNYLGNLLDFIYRKHALPLGQRLANVSRGIVDSDPSLTFTVLDSTEKQSLSVEIRGSKPLKVKVIPLDEMVPEERINNVKQNIIIAVELFEEKIRKSILYFAWREGEEIVPEELHGKEKKAINRLFLETQILLFVIFISVGMFLFLIVGWLAPVVLMAIQFVFVFYSNKIIAKSGDWRITESNPKIHLLEYHLPMKEHEEFRQTYSRDKLIAMKKEIYEETLAKKGEINCETAQQIFTKHGLECRPENLSTKTVNVYQLVKRTADKFGFPMPEVVVSNTMIPNAAASGPSPSRGVVLITTGLLVQLEDDEILSVLGHEFGHLKGRDPLLLYGLTAAEFLFRFYVLFPLFPFIFFSFSFFLYFWAVMAVIYFIAKFFEARADLVSATVIGQPQVLAEALEKIGFRRLLYERVPSYRVHEWISLEPHPPIYFRVDRLEKLKVPVQVKHPLIESVKDVTNGLLASLGV